MKILFMPGVGGDPAFWQPVADRLPAAWQKTLLGWPGLGNQPPAPEVNGWDDLYRTVEERIAVGESSRADCNLRWHRATCLRASGRMTSRR